MAPGKRWPRVRSPRGLRLPVALFSFGLAACSGAGDEPVALGPADGFDLPPTDLDRVAVGSVAPDFSLRTIQGDTLTLSAFRGLQNVVLVFYRGHW